jgi:murein DD-endopeptidase MepM/ murein hydrolase activator NlpD
MHQGIDIPGPLGTPVYATADGVIQRSGWASGYGNLVEINHGNGLETRYGHLSKLIAQPNERVRRGQLIGLMGSTGRSTGSHLHYEVRIAGSAVNPMPYIEGTNYEIALADARALDDVDSEETAMGGPEARSSSDHKDD